MINAKDLLWNRLSSLKDRPEFVQKMNAADCAWQKTLENLRERGPGVQVLVTGIQNSGKSTLCNLLVEDYDNGTFEIGDTEVTLRVQRARNPHTAMNIIDTPGFGTAAAKDAGFEQLWANADVLVFASSVLSGSISDNAEIKKSLKKIIVQSPDLANRICVLCTKMGDSENADEVLRKNREVVNEILGFNTPVFLVDSHWYQDAIKNDDRALAKASGILPFLDWLGKTSDLPSRQEQIFAEAKKSWLRDLRDARQIVDAAINSSRKKRDSLKNRLCESWGAFRSTILSAWEQCKKYAG